MGLISTGPMRRLQTTTDVVAMLARDVVATVVPRLVTTKWQALPGVATLRLTRLSIATAMLTIEAQKWLHDMNKKRTPAKARAQNNIFQDIIFQSNDCVASQGQNPNGEPWQQLRHAS